MVSSSPARSTSRPSHSSGFSKSYGSEGAEVLDVYLLEWFFGVERLSQGALENLVTHHLPVLHEEDRAQDRVGEIALALVLFDIPLAVEVRDPRLPVSAAY
jgi:hypothetical protein